MLPGPDQIVACPRCKGLAKYGTLVSGNTIGAVSWTDGKQIAPMMPHPPAVVKCRHCKECYWLSAAEEVGFLRWSDRDKGHPDWEKAQEVQEPSEEEYYQAIAQGLASGRKQERDLRVLAWWRSNDPFRDDPHGPAKRRAKPKPSTSPGRKKSLESLVGLLGDRMISDRVMKAEVLRQLGQFEAAKQQLDRVTARPWGGLVSQIRSLCDSRDTCVRVMDFGR